MPQIPVTWGQTGLLRLFPRLYICLKHWWQWQSKWQIPGEALWSICPFDCIGIHEQFLDPTALVEERPIKTGHSCEQAGQQGLIRKINGLFWHILALWSVKIIFTSHNPFIISFHSHNIWAVRLQISTAISCYFGSSPTTSHWPPLEPTKCIADMDNPRICTWCGWGPFVQMQAHINKCEAAKQKATEADKSFWELRSQGLLTAIELVWK